jgi:poly-gamma-glutamate synthesis protein (capsule biosynthesis protein)
LQGLLVQPPAGFILTTDPTAAQIRVQPGGEQTLAVWIYALVAPFPTIPDAVSLGELQNCWHGQADGPFAGRPLLLDQSTLVTFSALWGAPAGGAVQVISSAELLTTAWQDLPAWALVPFEALQPQWKVLEVDSRSPLRSDFVAEGYGLAVPFSLEGDVQAALAYQAGLAGLPLTNREADRLTTVMLTGVTALVRATAFWMDVRGILYPAEDIGAMLKAADITHISNEIPFSPNCPKADPNQEGLRFCSDPDYIQLMEAVGVDVVELTGDHFGDWGPAAMKYTLDLYREEGWVYYGGGYNSDDARQARLLEHNGNRLAFIGCNAKGGGYATASKDKPGAVACDLDWMEAEIARLTTEGYLVIATFQHLEYYTYKPNAQQVEDSRRLAKAGAVVVSGSQAHQPHGLEFVNNSLVHYGLGNLFFDQYGVSEATRQGFLDRHIFYNGRYIGSELITIYFVDFAKPRLATPRERREMLDLVFSASRW